MLSTKFDRICSQLSNVAAKSNMTEKHAAAILKGNKIIKSQFNHNMRSRMHNMNMPSIHAEAGLLGNAKYCFL